MSERETVTVVIPTKNAATLLERALESVAFADEIIVVDMQSEDETAEVCARYPQCSLVERDGYIEENVNFGFDRATSDWVMRLDTDEVVTPDLALEIQVILRSPPDGITGFEFWERPVMLGRELKHGFGRKHYRKMLFRRGTARYPARQYHEAFETSGVWQRAKHGYVHDNYRSVSEYLRKIDFYTTGDVERIGDLPGTPPAAYSGAVAGLRAFYLYFLKWRGYRDGWVGLVDASMRGVYQFVFWAKLRERFERAQR